ncbi:hypothetical protein WN51_14530 [Melipona quadrifasciata]|uniref:Uncharacterized protein n=1 Tax=Melipona quadrifasciata TaxID=166423 RepID=A0A0N0BFK5_9HYME|nr:hypothetical protein WN51_14530 [Melipona quadrifasciata]
MDSGSLELLRVAWIFRPIDMNLVVWKVLGFWDQDFGIWSFSKFCKNVTVVLILNSGSLELLRMTRLLGPGLVFQEKPSLHRIDNYTLPNVQTIHRSGLSDGAVSFNSPQNEEKRLRQRDFLWTTQGCFFHFRRTIALNSFLNPLEVAAWEPRWPSNFKNTVMEVKFQRNCPAAAAVFFERKKHEGCSLCADNGNVIANVIEESQRVKSKLRFQWVVFRNSDHHQNLAFTPNVASAFGVFFGVFGVLKEVVTFRSPKFPCRRDLRILITSAKHENLQHSTKDASTQPLNCGKAGVGDSKS